MNLITNRTQDDVDRLVLLTGKIRAGEQTEDEMAEYLAGMRGAYNYTDLNRVEQAVAHIADKLGITLNVKTDWTAQDVMTTSEAARYLDNIAILRSYGHTGKTPAAPVTMQGLTYRVANDIEQILLDAETVFDSLTFCGDIFCGEE